MIELAERCAWEAEHSKQVAAIALTLFDYTKRIHGLGEREREWLEYAGFLHDIGNHISYEKHHRHSHYLTKNGDLRGFEPDEIEVIALVTRYHRRATPKRGHIGYVDLSKPQRRTVMVLSAFLRLAETLDRSRHGVIRGVQVRERLGEIRISVQAVGDAELEVWAAHKQAGRSKRRSTARCGSTRSPTARRPRRRSRWSGRGRARPAARVGGPAGSVKQNVLPSPGTLSTQIRPS